MTPPVSEAVPIPPFQKWAITFTVMVVAFMRVLFRSVTNVILPHLQGSLSAGLDEVSWVITSYLAANAVIIPATGWLAGVFGRRRFFLICATLFVVSSFISGAAPDLTTLIAARIFQGLGGGPIIPLSQAILWEIFPFHQRGLAMAIWGLGFIFGPILGPTVGGYLADEWSWRWIFYINLPVGIVGFFMASVFLFDPPYLRRAARIDWWGLGLMVAGFRCLQLVLDRGEREDWFASGTIVVLSVVAICALAGFLIRELTTRDPILDLTVFADRNFATGATLSMIVGFGTFSGMLLVAVFTPLLAPRSQIHPTTLVSHITAWDPGTRERLAKWASHFVTRGSDAFTAERQAILMLYRETVTQAQLLAYADDFWLLAVMFAAVPLFLPLMRRIRMEPSTPATAPATERAAAHVAE